MHFTYLAFTDPYSMPPPLEIGIVVGIPVIVFWFIFLTTILEEW